jgi:hypothetical protein
VDRFAEDGLRLARMPMWATRHPKYRPYFMHGPPARVNKNIDQVCLALYIPRFAMTPRRMGTRAFEDE